MSGTGRSPHLDPARIAALGAAQRDLLHHLAHCGPCRGLVVAVLGPAAAEVARPGADAAIRRLLDRLETGAGLGAKLAEIEGERAAARGLVEELCAVPETWGVAGADPRYASPEVVWQLLLRSEDQGTAPALRLIDLATDIAIRLSGLRPEVSLYRQLIVEARCARADRQLDVFDLGEALRELCRAEAILTPDVGYARALYCRSLSRLRRHQGRWEEALALVARAVELFAGHATLVELGRAQIDQAWSLIETGEPDEAAALFETALTRVAGSPAGLAVGRLGLAVAVRESAAGRPVKPLLTEAGAAIARVEHAEKRLRLRWLAAQVSRRCGREWSAFRGLCQVLSGFLRLGGGLDAARVLVELLALCREQGWLEALKRPEMRQSIAAVMESPELHPRARDVLGFAVWSLEEAGAVAAEVLAHAGLYLITSRGRPGQPFIPTRSRSLVVLDWDQLSLEFRDHVCRAVGAGQPIARRKARQLTREQQDLISWRFEVDECARILFGGEAVSVARVTPPRPTRAPARGGRGCGAPAPGSSARRR